MNNIKRFYLLTKDYLLAPITISIILFVDILFFGSNFLSQSSVTSLFFVAIIHGVILGLNCKDLFRYLVYWGKERKDAILFCFLLNGLVAVLSFIFLAILLVGYALITSNSSIYALKVTSYTALYYLLASSYVFLATAIFTLIKADWAKILSLALMIALPVSFLINKLRSLESSIWFIPAAIGFIVLTMIFTFLSYNSSYSIIKEEK